MSAGPDVGGACPVYVSSRRDAGDATLWAEAGWAESPTIMSDGSLRLELHLTAPVPAASCVLIVDTPERRTLVSMLRRARAEGGARAARAARRLEAVTRDPAAGIEDVHLPERAP